MMITTNKISKRFGSFQALNEVSITVEKGKLVALLGPSGSGKTTLLRIFAGLDQADSGELTIDGIDASNLQAKDRQVGFVFQHYALFRHMTIADNIAFGLKVRKGKNKLPKDAIDAKVADLLSLVQLKGLAKRYPSQLSGGQRQRVALARALAVEPRLLLLDEPFGALDAQVRKDLRRWLRRLHDEMGLTSIFVTHDQEEALELADTVVVMNSGQIEQIGSPADIYDHPATPFVFQFLGNANRLNGEIKNGEAHTHGWTWPAPGLPDGPAVVFLRPHEIDMTSPRADAQVAKIRHPLILGPIVRAELELPDGSFLEVELSREEHQSVNPIEGSMVKIAPKRLTVFAGSVMSKPSLDAGFGVDHYEI
jgi:sulfate transport system ATP-binding protein